MLLRLGKFALSVVVVVMMGVAVAQPAGAQVEATETFDFGQLDGVQDVVSRTYSADFSSILGSATPGAEIDPAALQEQGMLSLVVLVAKFDDGGSAEDGLNALSGELKEQSDDLTGGAEIQEVDLGDLGDNREGYQATVEEEGTSIQAAVLVVQQDEFVYIAIGSSLSDAAVAPTKTTVEAMLDADEGGDDITTDEAGISSGGLWDKLPRKGDEAIGALTPVYDEQLYPAPEATPTA